MRARAARESTKCVTSNDKTARATENTVSVISPGHTCRRSCTRRNVSLVSVSPYYILHLYLTRPCSSSVQWRLNRNATRVLTFYSPETIDRYRHGRYITAPTPGSLREPLRLIHTGRRYYPAGFPRLICKPLENHIALFHPGLLPTPTILRENSGSLLESSSEA